jgi:hypothetical protein
MNNVNINNINNINDINDINNAKIANNDKTINNDNTINKDNYVDTNDTDNRMVEDAVTTNWLRNSIIAPNTLKAYGCEIKKIFKWILQNEPTWPTSYGTDVLIAIFTLQPRETKRLYGSRIIVEIKALLCTAYTHPLINLHLLTPIKYMLYLDQRRGTNIAYLSRSVYGNKPSLLFHLFCVHNRIGIEALFHQDLKRLFCGFLMCQQ